MAQVAFDTLKFVDTLKNAGVPEEQPCAISVAVKESHEAADVAIKGDIFLVKKDVAALASATKSDIALLRSDMNKPEFNLTVKSGAMLAVAVGVLTVIFKF